MFSRIFFKNIFRFFRQKLAFDFCRRLN
jgi:hypothetical protein